MQGLVHLELDLFAFLLLLHGNTGPMFWLACISTTPLSAVKLCQFASAGSLPFFPIQAHFANEALARDFFCITKQPLSQP